MNYPLSKLEEDIAVQDKRQKAIRKDRGSRYGKADDTLKNIARGGWMGAVLHANECMERLWTMYDNFVYRQIEPDPMDMEDACDDLCNYTRYIPILYNRKFVDVTVCACDLNQTYDPPVDMPNVVPWESPDVATCDEEWKRQPTKEID